MPELVIHHLEYILNAAPETAEDVDSLDQAYNKLLGLIASDERLEEAIIKTEAGSSSGHIAVTSALKDKQQIKTLITKYLDESGVNPAFVSTAISDNI